MSLRKFEVPQMQIQTTDPSATNLMCYQVSYPGWIWFACQFFSRGGIKCFKHCKAVVVKKYIFL